MMSQSDSPISRFGRQIKKYNVSLVMLIITMIAVSLYSINTASAYEAYIVHIKGGTAPLVRHLYHLTIGLFFMICCALIPAKRLRIPVAPLYIFVCILLLLAIPFFGKTINGATRWVRLPFIPMDIQPSEFLKLAIVMLFAFFASIATHLKSPSIQRLRLYYVVPLVISGFMIFPVFIQNISTGIIFGVFVLAYLFILKMPFRDWAMMTGVLACIAALAMLTLYLIPDEAISKDSRFYTAKQRVTRKMNSDTTTVYVLNDAHRQEQYAKIALANSGLLTPQGVGQSKMKEVLPMANSDYVYAVLIEELGIFALIGVPALYVWWFVVAGLMARREKNVYNRYLLYGIGLIYPLQALVNVVVVSGVFPTGQPLPFLSAGGSSLIGSCIALGLMLAISRRQYEREQEAYELAVAEQVDNNTEHHEA